MSWAGRCLAASGTRVNWTRPLAISESLVNRVLRSSVAMGLFEPALPVQIAERIEDSVAFAVADLDGWMAGDVSGSDMSPLIKVLRRGVALAAITLSNHSKAFGFYQHAPN